MQKRNFKEYAPLVIRVGLALVFILIGIDQFLHPLGWVDYFPRFLGANIVYYNAAFDIFLGLWLLFGFLVRLSSTLAALHLIGVFIVLGYNQLTIRDFGLFCIAVSIALHGADSWCWGKQM